MSKGVTIRVPLRAVGILVLFLLLTSMVAPIIADTGHSADGIGLEYTPDVESEEQQLEWNVTERGPNFIRRQNIIDPNQYSWESAPQWVETCCSNYAPYIYNETKKYYQIQSGLIGARIYKKAGIATFYNPDMTEVRVDDERWIVEYYDDVSGWTFIETGRPVNISVESDEYNINVTVSFLTDPEWGDSILTVKYIFREGMPLKHEVEFTNNAPGQYEFRVIQKWSGIFADKVKHDEGEVVVSSATTLNGSQFRFLKEEDDSFAVHENQWNMYYGYNETTHRYYVLENENLKTVVIDTHVKGLRADFVFGNWTLAPGKSLTIDPDTATLVPATEDGSVYEYLGDYTRTTDRDIEIVIIPPIYERGYAEWDVSSIPDTAIITNTVFKYEGYVHSGDKDSHIHEMMGTRPSTSSDSALWAEAGEGTIYAAPAGFPVVGENQQVDLGASADSDLQSQLASADWFAIGFQADGESSFEPWESKIEDEPADTPTPYPTLYVVYTPPVTVTQTFMSTTTIGTTVCIYTVIQVIIDPLTTVTVTSESYTTVTTETEEITKEVCETECETDTIHETVCETETETETECETDTVTHTTSISTSCETLTSATTTSTSSCSTSTSISTTATTTTTSLSSTVTVVNFCVTSTIPTSSTTILDTTTQSSTTTTCSTSTWTETTTYISTSVGA